MKTTEWEETLDITEALCFQYLTILKRDIERGKVSEEWEVFEALDAPLVRLFFEEDEEGAQFLETEFLNILHETQKHKKKKNI